MASSYECRTPARASLWLLCVSGLATAVSSSCQWVDEKNGSAYLILANSHNQATYSNDILTGGSTMPSQTVTTFEKLRLHGFAAGKVGGPLQVLLSDVTFSRTTYQGECTEINTKGNDKCRPAAFATSLSCGTMYGPPTAVIDLRGTPFAVAEGPAQWTSCGAATDSASCTIGKSAAVNCTSGGQRCELQCSGACETCAPKSTMGCGNEDPACDSSGYPVAATAVLQLVVYNESLLYAPGCPAPPPPNLTECVLNVQKWCKIDPENKTSCSSCVAGLMISSCPAGCVSHSSHGYECASKSMLQACVPPPTVQELQCEAVVKAKCAQNRTGGHSYAANYTKCLACMKVLPCPAACHDTPIGKCQPAWFEKGCKGLEPPRPPKPTKPGCANGFAGHGFGGPCAPVLGPAHCQIQVGVREHPFATKLADGVPVYEGEVIPVPGRSLFDSIETGTEMLFDVNTRATRRMRHNQDDFEEVVAQLKAQGPVPGKPPSIVPIYSTTFPFNGSDTSSSGTGPARLNYVQARNAMVNEFCAVNRSCLCGEPGGCDTDQSRAATYTNLLLEDYVLAAKTQVAIDMGIARVANMSLDVRLRVSTMKLADEIGINGALNDTSFKSWCTQSGVTLSDLGCTAWTKCPFSPNFANATANKKLYYWSNIADHVKGIEKVKGSFEQLKALLPNAKLGANWAPGARYKALDGTARAHHYVGWTFQWINVRHATLYLEKALCTVPTYF